MLRRLEFEFKIRANNYTTFLNKHFNREVVVLLYHRVVKLAVDSQSLAVEPKVFESQLEHLVKNYNVLSHEELLDSLVKKNLPRKSICITFDDGYLDNLKIAKPILESYDFPGIFFISTANIAKEREFWWDELEQYFLCSNKLPDKIFIKTRNKKFEFPLFSWANLDEPKRNVLYQWNAIQGFVDNPRIEAYLSCQKLFKTMDIVEREECFDQLWKQCSNTPVCRDGYRVMTKEELVEFNTSPLITLGAHTANHCALSCLTPQRINEEIHESKHTLARILNETPVTFSYPFGYSSDYGQTAVKVVGKAGFQSAFSVNSCRVDRNSDIFEIPRFQAPNFEGDKFKKWLLSLYN